MDLRSFPTRRSSDLVASPVNRPARPSVPGARQAASYPASHWLTIARSVTCFMVPHNRRTGQFRPPLLGPRTPGGRCVRRTAGQVLIQAEDRFLDLVLPRRGERGLGSDDLEAGFPEDPQ